VVYALPTEPAHRSVQAEPGDAERPAHLVPPWCAVDIRRWRAENPKAVAAYNAARRLGGVPEDVLDLRPGVACSSSPSVRCPERQAQHLRERKR
jgi:hypothetical protein